MATCQDVITSARITLNDSVPLTGQPRYSSTYLLQLLNDGLIELYGLRPDLRFGKYKDDVTSLTISAQFPHDGRERMAVEQYIVARAEFTEDQHVNSNRAQAALAMSKALAMGQ